MQPQGNSPHDELDIPVIPDAHVLPAQSKPDARHPQKNKTEIANTKPASQKSYISAKITNFLKHGSFSSLKIQQGQSSSEMQVKSEQATAKFPGMFPYTQAKIRRDRFLAPRGSSPTKIRERIVSKDDDKGTQAASFASAFPSANGDLDLCRCDAASALAAAVVDAAAEGGEAGWSLASLESRPARALRGGAH